MQAAGNSESKTAKPSWEAGIERIVEGVHRVPLPLPGDGLRAVNVYVLAEATGGLTLVDAGWAIKDARDRLSSALAEIGHDLGDVRRFLITHLHRDHFELAFHVRRQLGVSVELGRCEEPSLDSMLGAAGGHGADPLLDRLLTCGADDIVAAIRRDPGLLGGPLDLAPPDSWIDDGQEFKVGATCLVALHTPGHTRGHVVFHDPSRALLFAGDHVLPHITPSIGFEPVPAASPLADYMSSLMRVRGLPETRLLPAHGAAGGTTHKRIDELLAHHDERLRETDAVLSSGGSRTASAVANALGWTRRRRSYSELDLFNRMLAVNETAAHLDVLVERDVLQRTIVDGVAMYSH